MNRLLSEEPARERLARMIMQPSALHAYVMRNSTIRAKETIGWFLYGKPCMPERWRGKTIRIRRPPRLMVH